MATGDSPTKGAARHHLVEHDAEGVDVAAPVDSEPLGLLGREVGRGPHHEPGLGDLLVDADRPGDPEVGHLDLAVGGDEDVAGLDVAVDDPVAVRVGERLGDVGGDRGGLGGGERGLRADDRESASPSTYSMTMKYVRVGLAPVEDGDDVRV